MENFLDVTGFKLEPTEPEASLWSPISAAFGSSSDWDELFFPSTSILIPAFSVSAIWGVVWKAQGKQSSETR